MRGSKLTVRTIALLGAGSAAIHQLRYAIGYGDDASSALAAHPHGYMAAALPGVITALLIAIAATVLRVALPKPSLQPKRRPLLLTWMGCALALAAIYGAQETLEGAGAILGGGWIGVALALPAGLLVALAIRGADAAESLRIKFGLVIVRLLASARAAQPDSLHGRASVGRLRARGPPHAFVV